MSFTYLKCSKVDFNGVKNNFLEYSLSLLGDCLLRLDTLLPSERCKLISLIVKLADEEAQVELTGDENDLLEKIVGKIE